MANSTIIFIKQPTVIQKSWDQYYLKDINTSYSQDFESHHLHAQIIFYSISKFTGTIIKIGLFGNKNNYGPDLPETGRNGQIRPRSAATRAGEEIRTADRRGPAVSGGWVPNRYAPFLAVRSSRDRRPVFVVFAIEEANDGEARVWSGFAGGSPRVVRRRSGDGVRLRRVGRAWQCYWGGER
jgi:hypothetical protein